MGLLTFANEILDLITLLILALKSLTLSSKMNFFEGGGDLQNMVTFKHCSQHFFFFHCLYDLGNPLPTSC